MRQFFHMDGLMEHLINNDSLSSQSSGSKKIRWGILGTGKIANKFASEFSHTTSAELAAVASRNLERARSFACAHQITKAYGSYDELLNQEDIDIVYIGLVNSAHYPITRQALLAGKPVLCEKPFTLHTEQTEELILLARQKNLFLMEGLWTRTFPVINRVKEIISSQKYGNVTLAQMDFGFIGNLDPNGRLMNPKLGGGALYDVGIYPLTTAQHFLGDITEFQAMVTLSRTGVDTRVLIQAQHCSGALSVLHASIDTASQKEAYLFMEQATIHIPCPFWKPPVASCTIHGGGIGSSPNTPVETQTISAPYSGNGFEFEIEHVSQCLRDGLKESPKMPLMETLQTARMIEKIRSNWKIVHV